jgi:RND family efflux transporter MFP subunit
MAGEDLTRLRIDRGAGAARRRARSGRWIALALLAAAAGGYALLRYGAAVPVETAAATQAYPSQAYTLLNATGYVVAQRKAAVSSKATGRLEWLGVREGSQVKQGELLARLENRDVAAAMEQAAANVALAQANLEQGQAELREAERALARSRELLARQFVSQAAHDAVVARHERARAAIAGYQAAIAVAQASHRASRVAVEQTLIRAPFDGVVLTKNANVGDVITPFSSATGSQAAVVTMADMSTLEVEADVSESNIGRVRLEQPCEIQLDALPGARFRGVVHRLVPTVDRSKATVTAKIRFLEREPPPAERGPRTVVPPAALTERGGRTVVFVVRDGRAVETPVETGARIGELVEIAKGLAPGERVVLKPAAKLRDGAAVAQAAK